MAHQAARGDLSHGEREAFRALAAATPEVRAEGIERLPERRRTARRNPPPRGGPRAARPRPRVAASDRRAPTHAASRPSAHGETEDE